MEHFEFNNIKPIICSKFSMKKLSIYVYKGCHKRSIEVFEGTLRCKKFAYYFELHVAFIVPMGWFPSRKDQNSCQAILDGSIFLTASVLSKHSVITKEK